MEERQSVQHLRGAITTASGDRIPMMLSLHPIREVAGYSHAGRLDIPGPWIDEFARAMARFAFRSEDGEYFSQFLILEDTADPSDTQGAQKRGRMILLRETPHENVVPLTIKTPRHRSQLSPH